MWPLRELAAAQAAFIAKRHVGNIVVTMTPDRRAADGKA
jgi:hypothetical protein